MQKSLNVFMLIFLFLFVHNLQGQNLLSGGFFSAGGNYSSNSSHKLNSTLGEIFIGKSSNSSKVNLVGFWYISNNIVTSLENTEDGLPVSFSLSQNYPNPFNPATTINYSIPQTSHVLIKIYNIVGEEVSSLVNEEKMPGNYEIKFNASNLSSGFYTYRIQAGNFTSTRKMILLK